MPPDRLAWLVLICGLAAWGIIWGLIDTRRIIEAPFLYATGMVLILCPQMYVTAANPTKVPDDAFWVHSVMVLLCSLALYYGYGGKTKAPRKMPWYWEIKDRRLFWLGFACGATGSLGSFQLYRMGDIKEWRGWPVYWYTLSTIALPGISLMVISFVRSRRPYQLVMALCASVFPFLSIINAGRRSATIVLPLIYVVPWMLQRRHVRPPRSMLVLAGAACFVVVYAFPFWRDRFSEAGGAAQAISDKPLGEIVEEIFSGKQDKVLEVAESMLVIGARYQRGRYEWGYETIYNSLVELYVPGSLIGHDLKDKLRIGDGVSNDWVAEVYGVPVTFYTTKNGYADVFSQFSFAGFLVMYGLGAAFRRIRDQANERQSGRAVIAMCFLVTVPAAIAYGAIFLGLAMQVPQFLILWLACRYCTVRRPLRRVRPAEGAGRPRNLYPPNGLHSPALAGAVRP
ncbi:hypothetical protein [Paludibaculum fermentans]|uniref:Oligosaccharide repeat unit polymerase n=1 Tax=Paludibaculum fermentans TaxID=1473598 RepID=A0A7S7NK61_PALFE|nr:hypothetical protein [Paludibaculum fermentans]QOY85097.1 hypothetical protein IRI77_19870 [Paludibaculum fermentans]